MTARETGSAGAGARDADDRLAVIGMALRLPGAEDTDDLGWLLSGDRDEVGPVPPTRWARSLYPEVPGRGAFLQDPFSFDHARFGLSAEQAVRLDPQHRLVLEVGALALEEAGLLADGAARRTGVFVGSRMNSYGFEHGGAEGGGTGPERAAALWGRSQNFAASWLSDRFDLRGPSLVVDTACSSSLTAVWLACQSLASGSCETALVGGVDLMVDPLTLTMLTNAEALSPDGRCQTFDERANGYVPGEGAVALVLKPLRAALSDGDAVLASIVATHVNNDGRTMGVTTPSLDAQVDLLDEVYSRVDATTVGYVEAHGTGTAIGDPIEVRALTEVFGRAGARRGSVALGSLKRRTGHLHSAAGLAGLAKIVHIVGSGTVPPTAVPRPNPRLRLDESPFRLPERNGSWPLEGPRRAAVSSFGFGGTNAHVVVEAPTEAPAPGPGPGPLLLPLSADTPEGLRELTAQWLELVREHGDEAAGLCATAQTGRPHRAVRAAFRGRDASGLAADLRSRLLSPEYPGAPAPEEEAAVNFWIPAMEEPPAWLSRLCAAYGPVEEVVTRFEEAAGLGRVGFRGQLLELCTGVALATALREAGVTGGSVALPDDWRPLADHVWEGASLEESLARLLAKEPPAHTPERDGGLVARLEAPDAEPAEILDAVVAGLFESGRSVDWARRRDGRPRTGRTLPREQAQGPSLNLAEPRRSPETGEGVRLESDSGGAFTFSRVFGPGEDPIAQHWVHGEPMLPGVGWFDFLSQGVRARGDRFEGVSDVVFHRPLIPSGAHRVVASVSGDGRFEVRGDDGVPMVTGRLAEAGRADREPLAELLAECSSPRSGSGIYRWLRRIGYRHGRYYRNVAWVAARPGGTLARIEGGRQRALNAAEVSLFPGLLDSVTIVAISPDNPVFGSEDAPAFIPLSIGRLRVLGPLEEAAFVRTDTAFWNEEACRCTQVVTDARGRVLLALEDITAKRVVPTAFSEDRNPAGRADRERAGVLPAAPETSGPPSVAGPGPAAGPVRATDPVGRALAWFLSVAGVPEEEADTEFLSGGFDSAGLVELSDRLSREYGLDLYPTEFFEFPTPLAFARNLAKQRPEAVSGLAASGSTADEPATPAPELPAATGPAATDPVATGPVATGPVATGPVATGPVAVETPVSGGNGSAAVIGAALTLPCGESLEEFWDLLRGGRGTVGPLPDARAGAAFDGERPRASFLDRVDLFDPTPFRISPREAPLIDPQARLLYETVWRALEDAGQMGERSRGSRTGLWVAYSHDHYHEERQRAGVPEGRGLGLEAMIPNRLSHLMDWTGPSVLVNTLCSSSLVALHQAVRHLRSGEIDTAVVAGVHAGISPEYFRSMRDLGALSPTGLCRAFDADADGMVPGEGSLAVVLRRTDDALRDGDRVHTLIKGTAVNHGGRTSRYSAPSPRGQREVVTAALEDARTHPDTITLLEAHGTGTPLGDPIEIEGLTHAYRDHTQRHQYCAIGSIKTNIGHLEPAAGLAGLTKIILAMRHKTIPPTLHLNRPNPALTLETTPFYTTTQPTPWHTPPNTPRRAGLSAFGMGGVNAHIILQEPPTTTPPTPLPQQAHLLKITATTQNTVRHLAQDYADAVKSEPLGDFAYTVNTARPSYRHRAVVVTDAQNAERDLRGVVEGDTPITTTTNQPTPTAFIYTGQGSQHPNMGHTLYTTEPTYHNTINHCEHLLQPHTTTPLTQLLYGNQQHLLNHTQHAQIAIVTTQVALTTLLHHWGIHPHMAIGHSLGELTAAWACGTLTLPDLLHLTATRAHHMQQQPTTGTMATITGPTHHTQQLLHHHPTLEIAAYNSPNHTTITGPTEHIHQLIHQLGTTKAHPLNVSHAFHSTHMDGALPPFTHTLQTTPLTPPHTPLINGLTGTWHTPTTATTPTTWANQIRQPVHFHTGITTLHHHGARHFWEIGPQPHLTPHARTTLNDPTTHWHTTLHKNHP
ncbi:type I polyketide synthase, partial [Nocardiopsis quinghaiensis]|uniref:type I polyketide synthase n=1 Tax=Nocardiopsis quinghaiensis TaxID=464995 RepID=UPI00123997EB